MKPIKIVILSIILLLCYLPLRDSRVIPDHPLTEDSFYSLAVAKNISNGQFFTLDGTNPTNGFQPLFTVICSAPYFFFGKNDLISPLRIVLLISILNIIFSAFLFGKIIKDLISTKDAYIISAFIFISSPLTFLNYLNGLETGFVVLMLLFTWYMFTRINFNKIRDVILLGITLGLCVLTRIDLVWLVFVVSFGMFFKKDLDLKKRYINFLIISGFAFIISSPWWAYNYFIFGSLMPTSGKAQQLIMLDPARYYQAFDKILVNLVPHLFFWDRVTVNFVGIIARLFAIGFFIITIKFTYRKTEQLSEGSISKNKSIEFIKYILIYSLILVVWYSVTSWATHFYQRYFTPLSLIGLLITALAFILLYQKKPGITKTILVAIALPLIIGTVFKIFEYKVNGSPFYNYQLKLVQKNVPEQDIVASRQSGTLGYFKKNTVNCDGKVNNDVFKYSGKFDQYLLDKKITWVCDWKEYIDTLIGTNPETKGWVLVDKNQDFLLYHYKGN